MQGVVIKTVRVRMTKSGKWWRVRVRKLGRRRYIIDAASEHDLDWIGIQQALGHKVAHCPVFRITTSYADCERRMAKLYLSGKINEVES